MNLRNILLAWVWHQQHASDPSAFMYTGGPVKLSFPCAVSSRPSCSPWAYGPSQHNTRFTWRSLTEISEPNRRSALDPTWRSGTIWCPGSLLRTSSSASEDMVGSYIYFCQRAGRGYVGTTRLHVAGGRHSKELASRRRGWTLVGYVGTTRLHVSGGCHSRELTSRRRGWALVGCSMVEPRCQL
ncbi:hypothetical protein B0H17DRAFT_1052727 [Mycena rosella]|uniref:Uncharacterized protein n=1 Tax=Mycena rosella TaxID=1033263 RepID=A0AAD7GLK3_MYCRO|nr:hypothetical protein B0H17DRAFT_1052727 [Mycena rosella]